MAYVINEASQGQLVVAESEALQSLREACEAVGATLETLHFGKLDFGETAVLDRFYNAGEWQLPRRGRRRASPDRHRGECFVLFFSWAGSKLPIYITLLGSNLRGCRTVLAPAAPNRECVLVQKPVFVREILLIYAAEPLGPSPSLEEHSFSIAR